jgi:methyl-accepting chemotaxis protein
MSVAAYRSIVHDIQGVDTAAMDIRSVGEGVMESSSELSSLSEQLKEHVNRFKI